MYLRDFLLESALPDGWERGGSAAARSIAGGLFGLERSDLGGRRHSSNFCCSSFARDRRLQPSDLHFARPLGGHRLLAQLGDLCLLRLELSLE